MKKTVFWIAVIFAAALFTVTPTATAKAEETERLICRFSAESELAQFDVNGTTWQDGAATVTGGSMQTKSEFNGAISYLTLTYQTGFSVTYGEQELHFDGTSVVLGEESADCVLPQGEFTMFFRFLQSGVRIGVATEQDYADKVYETAAAFVWNTQATANPLGVKASENESVVVNEWKIYALNGVISGATENYDPNDTMRPEKETLGSPSGANETSGCASSLSVGSTAAIATGAAAAFAVAKGKRREK